MLNIKNEIGKILRDEESTQLAASPWSSILSSRLSSKTFLNFINFRIFLKSLRKNSEMFRIFKKNFRFFRIFLEKFQNFSEFFSKKFRIFLNFSEFFRKILEKFQKNFFRSVFDF